MFLPKHRIPEELVESAYRNLFEGFRNLHPLSDSALDYIQGHSKPVLYKPKEVLLNYGETCNYCLFALRGLVLSTFILDGLEKIVWFMGGGDTIIAVHSWFDQEPSEEKLVALKETLCIAVSWNDIQILHKDYPDFLALSWTVLMKHFVLAIQRTKWQQFSTEGKIENLELLYPKLMKEVPAKYLASYLGISRETFFANRRKKA